MRMSPPLLLVPVVLMSVGLSVRVAEAHCDTLNGPVVSDARLALQTNDVTPVLKWVGASEEAEVRQVFDKTRAVRTLSRAAQELADRYFFETVVRLHRFGEGEPYTGLKPESTIDPGLELADRALRDGNVEPLVKLVTNSIDTGVRERFTRARALLPHAGDSVAAGREYVAAYVEFIHFVEEAMTHGAEDDAHR